jgi:hypothetical protein
LWKAQQGPGIVGEAITFCREAYGVAIEGPISVGIMKDREHVTPFLRYVEACLRALLAGWHACGVQTSALGKKAPPIIPIQVHRDLSLARPDPLYDDVEAYTRRPS